MYCVVIEVFPKGLGFEGELKYCFSSSNGWTSRAYLPDFIRHVESLYYLFQGEL